MTDRAAPSTCRLVRAGGSFGGKLGLDYAVGISAESVGVIARTDPNEQESVVLLPKLDAAHPV